MNADTPHPPIPDAADEPPHAPATSPAASVQGDGPTDARPESGTDAPEGRDISPSAPAMTVKACAEELRARFPALFGGEPKPLKLRIHADIEARAPGVFPKPVLSAFFRRYTLSDAYLKAVSTGTHRFDLDGQPAAALSEEHRRIALETLLKRRQQRRGSAQGVREPQAAVAEAAAAEPPDPKRHKARHDAPREAQREQARAKRREAQRAERQFRANLLRAYETTTLTRENFCALKGIAPEALDGLLETARAERAQRQAFLAELVQAYRASGLSINDFAASKNMHPGQMHHLLREAQGGSDERRPAPRRDRPPRSGDRPARREGADRPRGSRH